MNTITSVTLVGEVERVERKSDIGKNHDKVAEFYLAGCGLRITAFGEQKADQVPDAGVVAIVGYLNTRTYEYEGKERTSTDIRATSITAVAAADDDSEPF